MPRKYKSTAAKNKRRIAKAAPTARNQKKQIASAQNQIVAIKNHLNLTKERMRWHCGFTDIAMTAYPLIIPLTSGPSATNPAVMNTVIGTNVPWTTTMTPAPQGVNTFRSKTVVNKQYVDLTVTAGNEAALLHLTAFVVQLQSKVATQTYGDTSSMSTLRRGQEYITPLNALGNDSGYGAYLNNQKFKIIKRLEFETGGYAPSPGAAAGTTYTGNSGSGTNSFYIKRTQMKLNYGSTLFKASGDVATTQTLKYADINPEQKRFIVIFSDNSLTDLEFPSVSMSSLITGYAAE